MTSKGQDRIPAGYVRRAHGIHGDVVIRGLLADSEDRFIVGTVLVTDEVEPRELEITSTRAHRGDHLVTFAEIDDRNAAEALVGTRFTICRSERRELDKGEWWAEDMTGCIVRTLDGGTLGRVIGVVSGVSQDRLVVETTDGVEGEVPFVTELVPEVDIEAGVIVVDLPEGLFG